MLILTSCAKKEDDKDDALLFLVLTGTGLMNSSIVGTCETQSSSGDYVTTVDARNSTAFVYCNLKSGGTTSSSSSSWDLRFQRYKVGTKSGLSGTGSGGACDTKSTNWNQEFTSSSCTFSVDENVTSVVGSSAGASTTTYVGSPAFKDWFTYQEANHTLKANSNIYIVRSGDGTTYFKVQMLDYYSSAGTAAYIKFKWKKL